MTDEQIKRWKIYRYHMHPDAYTTLFPKSNTELAAMVVDAYCRNVDERAPLFTFMLEQMIEYDRFPAVAIPKRLNRTQAVKILACACKAWLVEYVYHSQFGRFNIPEDEYFLEDVGD